MELREKLERIIEISHAIANLSIEAKAMRMSLMDDYNEFPLKSADGKTGMVYLDSDEFGTQVACVKPEYGGPENTKVIDVTVTFDKVFTC